MNQREDATIFEKTEMFFEGTSQIGSSLSEIKERLVKMAGKIVTEDEEEVFTEQIKKIMSDKMIKALQKYCNDKQGNEKNKMRRTKTLWSASQSQTSGYTAQSSNANNEDIFAQDEDEVQSETGNTEDGGEEDADEEEKQEETDQNVIDDAFLA